MWRILKRPRDLLWLDKFAAAVWLDPPFLALCVRPLLNSTACVLAVSIGKSRKALAASEKGSTPSRVRVQVAFSILISEKI